MTNRRIPRGLTPTDLEMSNFDLSIDDDMGAALRAGGTMAEHCAWNFHGDVWFEDGQFHEEVWAYGAYRETFSAETLEELMELANAEYGSA